MVDVLCDFSGSEKENMFARLEILGDVSGTIDGCCRRVFF